MKKWIKVVIPVAGRCQDFCVNGFSFCCSEPSVDK